MARDYKILTMGDKDVPFMVDMDTITDSSELVDITVDLMVGLVVDTIIDLVELVDITMDS